jgi:hypothetical protein
MCFASTCATSSVAIKMTCNYHECRSLLSVQCKLMSNTLLNVEICFDREQWSNRVRVFEIIIIIAVRINHRYNGFVSARCISVIIRSVVLTINQSSANSIFLVFQLLLPFLVKSNKVRCCRNEWDKLCTTRTNKFARQRLIMCYNYCS